MLYGASVYKNSIEVKVRDDGSAILRHRYLVLFAHGRRDSASAAALAASRVVANDHDVILKGLYLCPVPEKLDKLSESLSEIFEGHAPTQRGFSANLIADLPHKVDLIPSVRSAGLHELRWRLRWNRGLPESFWERALSDKERSAVETGQKLAILLYEVAATTDPKAYETNAKDFFVWSGEGPCGHFSFSIEPHPGNRSTFNFDIREIQATVRDVPFHAENDRVEKMAIFGGNKLELAYPLPGTSYKIIWNCD